jgi:hypothetical protein
MFILKKFENLEELVLNDLIFFDFINLKENETSKDIVDLMSEVERRSMDWSKIAGHVIKISLENDKMSYFLMNHVFKEHFWPYVSVQTLEDNLRRRVGWIPPIECFRPNQWEVFINIIIDNSKDLNILSRYTNHEPLWTYIPENYALALVKNGCVHWSHDQVLKIFFERFPESMVCELLDMIKSDAFGQAFGLLAQKMPDPYAPQILDGLSALLETSHGKNSEFKIKCASYLHYLVSKRVPEWERAYEMWSVVK